MKTVAQQILEALADVTLPEEKKLRILYPFVSATNEDEFTKEHPLYFGFSYLANDQFDLSLEDVDDVKPYTELKYKNQEELFEKGLEKLKQFKTLDEWNDFIQFIFDGVSTNKTYEKELEVVAQFIHGYIKDNCDERGARWAADNWIYRLNELTNAYKKLTSRDLKL